MESRRKSSRMFLDGRLDEEGAFLRIQTGGEPVDHHVDRVRPDLVRGRVVARERMPVGHKVVAFVIAVILQGNPVRKRAVEIAQMELPRGSHPAQNPFSGQIIPPEGAISRHFRACLSPYNRNVRACQRNRPRMSNRPVPSANRIEKGPHPKMEAFRC